MEKDIAIIGGGPGGYTAAIRAAQLGARVSLIEAENLGGTCLNKGCIPTKALYQSARLIRDLKKAAEFGVITEGFAIDLDRMMRRKRDIVDRLREGLTRLVKAHSVETVYGKASMLSANRIGVTGSRGEECVVEAKNIIIATGSVPAKPPFAEAGLPGLMTSDEILSVRKIPDSLAIIGGGAVGVEFAGIFGALGARVTLIEFLPRILADMDGEISAKLTLAMKKSGIDVRIGARVTRIAEGGGSLRIMIEGKNGEDELCADAVLVSAGRMPNLAGLRPESIGMEYDANGIKTDENRQTRVPGIYAVGDVTGGRMLAYVAAEAGAAAAEHIMGFAGRANSEAVPACVFTFPEAAAVGLSEEEARERGLDCNASKFLFGANGKALTMGEEEGFVKVLAEVRTKRIVGVHIMGPHASDLIHEAALAVGKRMTTDDIAGVLHAHPTLSEAFMEAALGIDGRAVHMPPKRPRGHG